MVYKYFSTLFFVVPVDSAICAYSRITDTSWLDSKFTTAQVKDPSKCMQTLTFFRKNGFVMQNHEPGIHSDKIWAESTT